MKGKAHGRPPCYIRPCAPLPLSLFFSSLQYYPTHPTSVHFVVSIFVIMLMSSEIQKMKCGLRWVEVDLNPPQPTSIHFVFSIFVFMLISRPIKKSKCRLRWVEVDLNPRQPTSIHFVFFIFVFMFDIKAKKKKVKVG